MKWNEQGTKREVIFFTMLHKYNSFTSTTTNHGSWVTPAGPCIEFSGPVGVLKPMHAPRRCKQTSKQLNRRSHHENLQSKYN